MYIHMVPDDVHRNCHSSIDTNTFLPQNKYKIVFQYIFLSNIFLTKGWLVKFFSFVFFLFT